MHEEPSDLAPCFDGEADCDAFLEDHSNIRVGLPVPAKCTVEAKTCSSPAAAKRAGIREPLLLSEPAAALVHDLTQQMGQSKDLRGRSGSLLPRTSSASMMARARTEMQCASSRIKTAAHLPFFVPGAKASSSDCTHSLNSAEVRRLAVGSPPQSERCMVVFTQIAPTARRC
jgi:hypothetical protein